MQQENKFISAIPQNSLIAKYISYYYFQETSPESYLQSSIYYPHFGNAFNVYKNAHVSWDDKGRIIESCKEEKLTCLYTIPKGKSRVVTMIGINRKIGIIFKPLGVNHFIDCSLGSLVSGIVSPFDYFGKPFLALVQKVYEEPDIQEKAKLLDSFFVENYKGFDHPKLEQIIHKILTDDVNYSIEDMAIYLGTNRKMVYRLFKKHFCCSPSEFKSIVKFRKALDASQDKDPQTNLTNIAFESGYYDQAEFIKRYKALVGLTPKELYNTLKKFGKSATYWTPIDD